MDAQIFIFSEFILRKSEATAIRMFFYSIVYNCEKIGSELFEIIIHCKIRHYTARKNYVVEEEFLT